MNKNWNVNDIPSLDGKVVIVTGGNSGLGYESAKALSIKNARVILACRSLEKANQAINKILKESPNSIIEAMLLDLGNLKSVKDFSEAFKEKYNRLDILLNNAGVMNVPYGQTKDGFENQIGINHLGHFALTKQLFDLLKSTPNSRIVNVSSLLHKKGHINFDSFMYSKNNTYSKEESYAQSKLANLLFTYELDRRIKKDKLDIKVLTAHPGGAKTNLGRYQEEKKSNPFLKFIYSLLIQTAEQGALSSLRAATDPSLKSGLYIGPSGFMQASGAPDITKAANQAYDARTAKELWEISKSLTRI